MNKISSLTKDLLILEFQLIFRNKRIIGIVTVALAFLLYFLVMSLMGNVNLAFSKNEFLMPLNFIFFYYISGFLMFSYGQFTLLWESSYSYLIFTTFFPQNSFLKAKFYSLTILCTIPTIIIVIILLFNNLTMLDLTYIITSLVYNIGINTFWILLFSKFNKGYVNLYENNLANHKITNLYQFTSSIFNILISYSLYYILYKIFNNQYIVLCCFIGISLCGIFIHKKILDIIAKIINNEKYNLIASSLNNVNNG